MTASPQPADIGHDRESRTEIRLFLLAVIRRIDPRFADALTSDDLAFTAVGMDSIHATEVGGAIAEAYNLPVRPTVALEHPTLGSLASHVLSTLEAGRSTRPRVRSTTVVPSITIVPSITDFLLAAAQFQ